MPLWTHHLGLLHCIAYSFIIRHQLLHLSVSFSSSTCISERVTQMLTWLRQQLVSFLQLWPLECAVNKDVRCEIFLREMFQGITEAVKPDGTTFPMSRQASPTVFIKSASRVRAFEWQKRNRVAKGWQRNLTVLHEMFLNKLVFWEFDRARATPCNERHYSITVL